MTKETLLSVSGYRFFTSEDTCSSVNFVILKTLDLFETEFNELSNAARNAYLKLLKRTSLSLKNGWVDDKNHAYIICTIEELQKSLNCCKTTACNALKELEKMHLVKKVRRGQGAPSLLYVCYLNEDMGKDTSVKAGNVKSEKQEKGMDISANGDLCIEVCHEVYNMELESPEDDIQEVHNVDSSYKRPLVIAKRDINQSNQSKEIERKNDDINFESIYDYFLDTLDWYANLDFMCSEFNYCGDEKTKIMQEMEFILRKMCEAYLEPGGLSVKNVRYASAAVQSRFMKISFGDIWDFYQRFIEMNERVHNIDAYIKASLFNSVGAHSIDFGNYFKASYFGATNN